MQNRYSARAVRKTALRDYRNCGTVLLISGLLRTIISGGRFSMKKKHILILATTNDFLGKFELDNVEILQKMGYTVHYASNMNEPSYVSDEEWIRKMGIRTHHIEIARSPFMISNNRKALVQLINLIKKYEIQAIHCHTPVGGVLGRIAGKLIRKRDVFVIYTAHGFHFYKGAPLLNQFVYYGVEKRLARDTDMLLVINEEDYQKAKKFHLKKGGHVYKTPGPGVDCRIFKPVSREEKHRLRKEMELGDEEFVLISVGELNENKNHRIVLEALRRLREKGTCHRKLRYLICGDGFLKEQMKQWIHAYDLENVVKMCGYTRDVPRILGCADVSVFPSKREGLGMAGLESLAMGISVIAADNRGTREYMEHEKNGFVCRYDKPEEFEKCIEKMMNLSEKRRREMEIYSQRSVAPFVKKYSHAVMRRIYSEADKRIGGNLHGKEG